MPFLPFSPRARTWETIAIALRRLAQVPDGALIVPEQLAAKIGLHLVDAQFALQEFSEDDRQHLLGTASDNWSGGVFPQPLPDGKCICIINPNHPPKRNRITLMEEIVHKYRNHVPTGLREVLPGLRARTYDQTQEAEAYGVGAAVLLPWKTFYHMLDSGTEVAQMADAYEVTVELIKYRIKVTGASNLYRNRCLGHT